MQRGWSGDDKTILEICSLLFFLHFVSKTEPRPRRIQNKQTNRLSSCINNTLSQTSTVVESYIMTSALNNSTDECEGTLLSSVLLVDYPVQV